jgi:hypothetical protein
MRRADRQQEENEEYLQEQEQEQEQENHETASEENSESAGTVNTSNRSNANSLKGGFRNGFNRSGNLMTPELLEKSLETIGSTTDFERLYLGWLNNPSLPKITEIDLQIRKNSLKSLFRFVFGKKTISEATATTFQKKLRIAYTPLTTEEKVPCKPRPELLESVESQKSQESQERTIWEDFHESLKYRRKQAMCELYAARDIVGEETFYVSQKKKLILGLRDLIDVMERNVYPCMEYGYDISQHEPDDEPLLSDEEYARLLAIFRTFVKDRRKGEDGYSYNMLRRKLSKKDKQPEKPEDLYEQLLKLLTWMEGEVEAIDQINKLKSQIIELETVSKEQKDDILDLENIILVLMVVISLTQKIHVLQLSLEEMKCKVANCCKGKQELPIGNLEKSLQNHKEQYNTIVKDLRKKKETQSEEVQRLEDTIISLTSILLSINKLHEEKISLEKVNEALEKIHKNKREVEEIIERLKGFEGSVAMSAVSAKALELANQTIKQLEKQIAELTTKYPDANTNINVVTYSPSVDANAKSQPATKNQEIQRLSSRISQLQPNKGEPKTDIQRGGAKEFCSTLLTLLMVEANKNKDFDYKEFVKKANTTLEELGQCPLVLKALGELVDQSMNENMSEEGYIFSPLSLSNQENQEFAKTLEKSYNSNFTDEERSAMNSFAPPFILHAESPEEFQDVLGKNSYFLNASNAQDSEKDIPLYGIGQDDIVVTPEERKVIEKGGVPAGGLLVLYLVAGLNKCKKEELIE